MKVTKCDLVNDPANKNTLDAYNLNTLLCTCILALSIVMAGTCDVECLKMVRILRKRFQDAGNM